MAEIDDRMQIHIDGRRKAQAALAAASANTKQMREAWVKAQLAEAEARTTFLMRAEKERRAIDGETVLTDEQEAEQAAARVKNRRELAEAAQKAAAEAEAERQAAEDDVARMHLPGGRVDQ